MEHDEPKKERKAKMNKELRELLEQINAKKQEVKDYVKAGKIEEDRKSVV